MYILVSCVEKHNSPVRWVKVRRPEVWAWEVAVMQLYRQKAAKEFELDVLENSHIWVNVDLIATWGHETRENVV